MIEKFTFELHAPKVPPGKIILVKNDLELRNHVILKLLGYLIYYEPGLKVEISAGMHYKPDLLVPGDHTPKVWIDCGKVTLKKVESLSAKLRHTRVIFIKETQRELETFKKLIGKKAGETGHFEYLAFEPGFIASLASALQRTNHITLYEVMENTIGIALNDEVFESTLYH
ncbi:MAG TPA: YaeQ family protein [bacterium]|nr:YaeQ family protein [bacterium]